MKDVTSLGNQILWLGKKQWTLALSTVEAEDILATNCFSQILCYKSRLEDYNVHESNISIFHDNGILINLTKNSILHSRTKYIEIKHHFIRRYFQKV